MELKDLRKTMLIKYRADFKKQADLEDNSIMKIGEMDLEYLTLPEKVLEKIKDRDFSLPL